MVGALVAARLDPGPGRSDRRCRSVPFRSVTSARESARALAAQRARIGIRPGSRRRKGRRSARNLLARPAA
jgi:hypothetical protein